MQKQFTDLIHQHEQSLKNLGKAFTGIGFVKLFLVLTFGISLYYTISKGFPAPAVIISAAAAVLLVFFWIYHAKLQEKMNGYKALIALNNRQLDRLSGNWVEFDDIGEEFIDPEHAYACDLDIVGKKSLFQLLNVTNTWHGRQIFAADLLHPSYSGEEIQKRQKAVLELSGDADFSSRMAYLLSKIGADKSQQKLIDELKDSQTFMNSKNIKFLLRYLPFVTILLLIITIIIPTQLLYVLSAALLLIQAIAWIIGIPKMHTYLSAVDRLPYKLDAYAAVFERIKKRHFASEKLNEIQARLGTSALSADKAIRELGRIANRMAARNDAILRVILNILFLWDYESAFLLEEWKTKYAGLAEGWFLCLGEFESLLSFSNLPLICKNTCVPEISRAGKIDTEELGHPLLSNAVRISNDFRMDEGIFIISGSNMSGKTTFLRTVGINLVLAQAGSVVCAKRMRFSPCRIVTSMRIADDLSEGISTFYAELKRIKKIVDAAKSEPNLLFLIDEIFRGTNSVDRLCGAKTVLSKLNSMRTSGIITTHDLELCDMAEQFDRIRNFSFSEQYQDHKILFDYQIKPGKSTTTNARYLMEMVGIL